MPTDVRLDEFDGTFLLLDARVVKSTGSDFMLDSPQRRQASTPFRRALVHNQSDGLTMNFNNDYPGGISLVGVADITPRRRTGELFPTLVVHGGISYEAQGVKIDGSPATITVFLDAEIAKLQSQIADLTAKVEALQKK